MKVKHLVLILFFISCNSFQHTLSAKKERYQEIHCKHFIYGYPAGTPSSNDLIIRDAYALSSNDATKMADWVAYRIDSYSLARQEDDVEIERSGSKSKRKKREWKKDPWLDDDETLEPSDYRDAHKEIGTDRGHQSALASVKGSHEWYESNYLSNITPQRSDLNQGPWLKLENKERELAVKYGSIYVMTGPLYERDMPTLPGSDKLHRIPSGYWKILVATDSDSKYTEIHWAAFIFDQRTLRTSPILDHLVKISEIEKRSRLDFFWRLTLDEERRVESTIDESWIDENFR